MLYLSTPNQVFAVDARTGEQIWHYVWPGNNAIGNRGVGMFGNWLYVATPDNSIISLDAAHRQGALEQEDGARRQRSTSATSAPVVIRNHVIVGIGGDGGGSQSFLESLDPETGASQWKWLTTPGKGEPGIETWPSAEVAALSAGAPWQPPTYDPALNLLYVTTGQPTPTYNGKGREGDNLYTCSVVALNPDTGKMAWYYQFSPHDTHDWDATQVPVLIDGVYRGSAEEAAGAGESQRLFLPAGPDDRKEPGDRAIRRVELLSRGRQRPPGSESGERRLPRRRAGLSGLRRRRELSVAVVQSGHGSLLCQRDGRRQHLLPGEGPDAPDWLWPGLRMAPRSLHFAAGRDRVSRPARSAGSSTTRRPPGSGRARIQGS